MNSESCCHIALDVFCCVGQFGQQPPWTCRQRGSHIHTVYQVSAFPTHQMAYKSERTCHQNGSNSSFFSCTLTTFSTLHLSTMYRQKEYIVAMYPYIMY